MPHWYLPHIVSTMTLFDRSSQYDPCEGGGYRSSIRYCHQAVLPNGHFAVSGCWFGQTSSHKTMVKQIEKIASSSSYNCTILSVGQRDTSGFFSKLLSYSCIVVTVV